MNERVELWYIECKPIRAPLKEEQFMQAARGVPMSGGNLETRTALWALRTIGGIGDNRQTHIRQSNRRVEAWVCRKAAATAARQMNNEFWTCSVKKLRVIELAGKAGSGGA
jgi:hypothetical protein